MALARTGQRTLLVDASGDLPSIFGMEPSTLGGLAEWLRVGPQAPRHALLRVAEDVLLNLRLVSRGQGEIRFPEAAALRFAQEYPGSQTVVDLGELHEGTIPLAQHAEHSFLVSRLCYLALTKARTIPLQPTGVVTVEEAGRVLRAADVAESLGTKVLARLPWDPAIARAVDSGRFGTLREKQLRGVESLVQLVQAPIRERTHA